MADTRIVIVRDYPQGGVIASFLVFSGAKDIEHGYMWPAHGNGYVRIHKINIDVDVVTHTFEDDPLQQPF